MICKICGKENKVDSLFCRECLGSMNPFPDKSNYTAENFEKLRATTVLLIQEEISPDDYQEFLSGFNELLKENYRDYKSIEIPEEIEEEVGYQADLTLEGIELFSESVEILSAYRDNPDKNILLEGLDKAEKGNHILNEALVIIKEQEDGEPVILNDII